MSNVITRILFAGASLVLTSTLTAAAASASIPHDAVLHQTTVRYADLDLSNAAGRYTLERRLNAAANRVCTEVSSRLDAMTCRNTAVAKARVDVQRAVATAS